MHPRWTTGKVGEPRVAPRVDLRKRVNYLTKTYHLIYTPDCELSLLKVQNSTCLLCIWRYLELFLCLSVALSAIRVFSNFSISSKATSGLVLFSSSNSRSFSCSGAIQTIDYSCSLESLLQNAYFNQSLFSKSSEDWGMSPTPHENLMQS